MNPNDEQTAGLLGPDFERNPFEGLFQQNQAPQQPQDPQAQIQALQDQQDPKKNQLLPGANPGTSKFLLGAIQQLQGFIADSTERDEIAIGRSVIQLLTRLVAKDQQRQSEQISGANQPQAPAQGPTQQPPQPQGQPQGY